MSAKPYLGAKNTKEFCALLGLSTTKAPKIELRRELIMGIRRTMEKQGLTHEKAAKASGVGRTVITAVVNGNLVGVSTDRLLDIASAMGLRVKVKVA